MILNFNFFHLFSQRKSQYPKIERLAKKLVKRKKVPGISISVIKEDRLVYSKGLGYADLKNKIPVNPNETLFRIASVSKPISAIGLAKAVLYKKIDLKESIYTYLPDYPKKKYDFTIEQIGANIAGLRSYRGNEFINQKPLSIEEGIGIFKDDILEYEPGTKCVYTSFGWNLISLVLQKQLDLPFDKYIETEILKPINLNQTIPDFNQDLSQKAVFYRKSTFRRFREAKQVDNRHKLASGGYLSTSQDIANFGKALLNNTLIPEDLQSTFTNSQFINGKKTYYGIGFESSLDHKGRVYYGHTGNGLGGYAIFRVYPNENIVISILMNCSNPNQTRMLNKLVDGIFNDLEN